MHLDQNADWNLWLDIVPKFPDLEIVNYLIHTSKNCKCSARSVKSFKIKQKFSTQKITTDPRNMLKTKYNDYHTIKNQIYIIYAGQRLPRLRRLHICSAAVQWAETVTAETFQTNKSLQLCYCSYRWLCSALASSQFALTSDVQFKPQYC